MLQKQKIKKLALIAAEKEAIPQDIEQYVLEVMTKQELKDFLRYYKSALEKKRVHITTSTLVSNMEMANLKEQFKNKSLIISEDKTLGGGIRIRENDTIIDFTFKKYINDTIEKLKN